MKKYMAVVVMVLAGLMIFFKPAAQAQNVTQPEIIRFSSDRSSVSLLEAETGAEIELSWHVTEIAPDYHLALEAYQGRKWVALFAEDEVFTGVGSKIVAATHPLNFGFPTYRLSVRNAEEQIVDERTLILAYDPPTEGVVPSISLFTTAVENDTVDITALRQDVAQLGVAWEVLDRLPMSNLLFEQVLPDGTTVAAEFPRENLWVASSGVGAVKPILPVSGTTITLRLSIVKVDSTEVYAAAEITVPINTTPSTVNTAPNNTVNTATIVPPNPTLPPAPQPTGLVTPGLTAISAFPTAAKRGETVQISWTVVGVPSVALANCGKDQMLITGLQPTFTQSYTIPADYPDEDMINFCLYYPDANGQYTHTFDANATVGVFVIDANDNPSIISFTADRTSAKRGESINFLWETRWMSSATLTVCGGNGDRVLVSDFTPLGGYEYLIPADLPVGNVTFCLLMKDNQGQPFFPNASVIVQISE